LLLGNGGERHRAERKQCNYRITSFHPPPFDIHGNAQAPGSGELRVQRLRPKVSLPLSRRFRE
jgi:hypothetical protein